MCAQRYQHVFKIVKGLPLHLDRRKMATECLILVDGRVYRVRGGWKGWIVLVADLVQVSSWVSYMFWCLCGAGAKLS
jgi:hypothetical protein